MAKLIVYDADARTSLKAGVDKLADAIVEAGSKTIRERAQTIGQNIRSEEGVRHAIRLIESRSPSTSIF